MGQLENLRELSIPQADQKKKKENKVLTVMPWLFNLMGIQVNFERLSHCTLELI
jgi:hypothetical protein